MKTTHLLYVLLFGAFLSFAGCKKKGCTDPNSISYDSEAKEDDGSCEYAGLGGSATIVALPKHHNQPIVSGDSAGYMDTAYVKFNAVDLPGINPGDYDLVVVGDSGESHVHLEGLKRGKYFIFMTGWDKSINKRVLGGRAYTLTQSTGEVDVEIPVTED